ncbi:hypothetical protein SANTM175S_09251 [Streptomyces antimycoticus]
MHGMVPLPCSRRATSTLASRWRSWAYSKISVTMDVYTHVPDALKREAIAHMDRMLGRRRR